MSYQDALVAAGANVHCFEQFGSYQGDWWAKVTFKGETGWINGSYGSCSGCDSFESEFSCVYPYCEDHWNETDRNGCEECKDKSKRYAEALERFGKTYLEDALMTQEKAEAEASKNLEWDSDAQGMLDYIKANK